MQFCRRSEWIDRQKMLNGEAAASGSRKDFRGFGAGCCSWHDGGRQSHRAFTAPTKSIPQTLMRQSSAVRPPMPRLVQHHFPLEIFKMSQVRVQYSWVPHLFSSWGPRVCRKGAWAQKSPFSSAPRPQFVPPSRQSPHMFNPRRPAGMQVHTWLSRPFLSLSCP